MSEGYLSDLQKLWYWLTAYLPRLLPRDEVEYNWFLTVCFEAFQVPDSLQARATLAAQVGAVPGWKIRKGWGYFANQAKRLTVNKVANEYKIRALSALQDELESKMAEQSEQAQEEAKEFIADV